jgi:hypothetical protein
MQNFVILIKFTFAAVVYLSEAQRSRGTLTQKYSALLVEIEKIFLFKA